MYRIFTFLFFIVSFNLSAQTGKITGKVTSTRSGEPLISANVTIEGTNRTVTTDLNGSYSISGLAPKTYVLVISYVSYAKKIVDDVVVKSGEAVVVNISLEDQKTEPSADVVVTRTRATAANTSALLSAQKNSASVSDGISAELIRKTPDRTTSDVLKRISGASIQDDRFAIIRGLNDRYNAAYINGAPLPSSESDRKAFAFDIFPSNILDNLVIYKTATPDVTGDFAGGLINITTKSIPAKSYTQISFSVGYNTLSTGNQFFRAYRGKKDFIGLDDGYRKLPSNLPSPEEFRNVLSKEQKADAAKLFGNYKWGLDSINAGLNFGFQVSKGLNVQRKGKDFFGMVVSVTYNNVNSFNESVRNSYEVDITGSTSAPIWRGKYVDKIYNKETLLGLLANFSLKLSPTSTISFKNIYSINSDNRVIKRNGPPDYDSDSTFNYNISARAFTSNQIFSSQLLGEHLVGKSKLKISWIGSFGDVRRDIPNLSRFVRLGYGTDLYPSFSNGPSVTLDGGTNMFFSTTAEKIYNGRIDFAQPFKLLGNSQNFIKVGGNYQRRERDFNARNLGFQKYNVPGQGFDQDLLKLPEDKIFAPENLGKRANGKGGFLVEDANQPTYSYDAKSDLKAGYIMADQRFVKKLRLIYGVRIENFTQQLNSFLDYNKPTNNKTEITDYLPSANFVYSMSAKQNIRLSYSKTINRPELRELAPFLFFDFVAQYGISGYDSLKRAQITNYDFRYELFPGKAQLISVSAFYKAFTNPIEILFNPDFNQATYSNSKTARVYGVEAEFRTLLSTVTGAGENSFLSNLTLSANAALMRSVVKLGVYAFTDTSRNAKERQLQGQSPYLFNGSLNYNNEKIGLSATISYNKVGPRIFIAGTLFKANIYENPRDVIDIQIAKSLFKNKLEIKLNARDILAQHQLFFYDFDKSAKYDSTKDKVFYDQIMPRVISLNASYLF